ncbi:MAG: aminodeoxychorismate synthase component I [Actinomycetota bacterium]
MSFITVISKLDVGIEPADIFYLLKGYKYLSFLDSSLEKSKYSKYSYIGWDPAFALESYGFRNSFYNLRSGIKVDSYQHPLNFLGENIEKFSNQESQENVYMARGNKLRKVKNSDSLPDFLGGFVGFFSYDLKNYIEKLPDTVADDYNMPLIYLVYFNRIIAFSHRQNSWFYIRNFCQDRRLKLFFPGEDSVSVNVADKIIEKINSEKSTLVFKKEKQSLKKVRQPVNSKLVSNFRKEDYINAVSRAKEYIHNGDIYQVNISQRFNIELNIDPAGFYTILRQKNSAPFSAFIGNPKFSIASSSPERFLYIKRGDIETRPIKGTRPRGKNKREDNRYARELKSSLKDRAELNMIVDLERNDLGKICYYGSVKVAEHAKIEKYAKVIHSVSTVVGKIKENVGFAEIIKATFPGGSITGAPKIRAMEIIDELEPTARSVYTGSIGYIGINGTADLNIAIRTIINIGNNYYYNVGGGIVEDSNPGEEYKETLDKGIALKQALEYFFKYG